MSTMQRPSRITRRSTVPFDYTNPCQRGFRFLEVLEVEETKSKTVEAVEFISVQLLPSLRGVQVNDIIHVHRGRVKWCTCDTLVSVGPRKSCLMRE